MTEPSVPSPTSRPYSAPVGQSSRPQPANLADILERVLDKGIIIAGDIRVNLLDIELLTIKIRLLIVSVDKAQEMGIDWCRTPSAHGYAVFAREMGIDWWRNDPMLTTSEQGLAEENRLLRERLEELESSASTNAGGGSVERSSRGESRG